MDKLNKKEYKKYVKEKVPKPTYTRNIFWAFIVGGLICTLGQVITNWFSHMGASEKIAGSATSITLIFLGALLTGIGVYDKISKKAGAGAAVPITGFANSIVAPAMEFRREGLIFGVAAKMFIIAGPVLVYGIGTSVVVGLIYLLLTKGL